MLAFGAIIVVGQKVDFSMAISELHMQWLDSRGVLNAAMGTGIYSGRRDQDGQVNADAAGDILVFPFIRNEAEIGAKYRAKGKRFWQKPDCPKLFFNGDVLDDPSLIDGSHALVIVEGEVDALSFIEAGYPFVVSVPDGAPPARDKHGRLISVPEGTADIDIDNDDKFSFIVNEWDALAKIKSIIIATDGDEPGQRLAKELVRRLDKIRCMFVTYPEGCKDANEVLGKFGKQAVLDLVKNAKPYPVSGVYTYEDLPPELPIETVYTGWDSLNGSLNPYRPAFMVVTGFPGNGKSTWTVQLAAHLAYLHGWNIGLASFEMRIKPYVTDQISGAFKAIRMRMPSGDENLTAERFIQRRFYFIAPDPEDDDTVHDIDWLLERMTTAVIRHGMKVCIIDPWNEIEHRRERDESNTDYTGRAIRKLKAFARRYDVLVIVVAHPVKGAGSKEAQDLGLYDISDSSHWANKADIGVVVARLGDLSISTETGIFIKKIRYQPDAGQIGDVSLNFNRTDRIFEQRN